MITEYIGFRAKFVVRLEDSDVDCNSWCVAILVEGRDTVFNIKHGVPLTFGSERDANLAARALNDAGIMTPEAARKAGKEKLRRICCEALLW